MGVPRGGPHPYKGPATIHLGCGRRYEPWLAPKRYFVGAPLPGWEEARKVAALLVEVATPRDGYAPDHALAIANLSRRVGAEFYLS